MAEDLKAAEEAVLKALSSQWATVEAIAKKAGLEPDVARRVLKRMSGEQKVVSTGAKVKGSPFNASVYKLHPVRDPGAVLTINDEGEIVVAKPETVK